MSLRRTIAWAASFSVALVGVGCGPDRSQFPTPDTGSADVRRMDAAMDATFDARIDTGARDTVTTDLATFDRPDISMPTDTFVPTDTPAGMCPSTCTNSTECQTACPSVPSPAAYCCLASTCVYVADGMCSGSPDVVGPTPDSATGDTGGGTGSDSGGGCATCASDSDCTRCGKTTCLFGTCL